jgi:hypothetical protein
MEELGRKSVGEFKESPKTPVIAVLENVRSAYNVGSVFRTADAFLIEALSCAASLFSLKKSAETIDFIGFLFSTWVTPVFNTGLI